MAARRALVAAARAAARRRAECAAVSAAATAARPTTHLADHARCFSSSSASTSSNGDGHNADYRVISIDRAGLARGHEPAGPSMPPSSLPHTEETPLAPHLRALIRFRGGPITVAEWMSACLTHPTAGYYTARPAVFGAGGDFVTGPEVSQLMGELVGVWCAAEWAGPLGRPPRVRLVELGPGRGTLAADLLRGSAGMAGGAWAAAIGELVCVEVSPHRRAQQWAALRCRAVGGEEAGEAGPTPPPPCGPADPPIARALSTLGRGGGGGSPIPVTWAASLADVPAAGHPTLYIAHEFFDALPVHQFQRVDAGQRAGGSGSGGDKKSKILTPSGRPAALPTSAAWRERLVDADEASGGRFRFVLAPGPTPASATVLPRRLAGLDTGTAAGLTALEVCLVGMAVAADLARRVAGLAGAAELEKGQGEAGGAKPAPPGTGTGAGSALIIDYGRAGPPYADSLVGIRGHAPAGVLEAPGAADLSARVDFGALAQAVAEDCPAGAAAVHGPIPQAHFLLGLGLAARLQALETAAGGPGSEAGRAVRLGALRLVGGHEEDGGDERGSPAAEAEASADPDDVPVEGMGYTYQVMAITAGGRAPPAPF
jgi:NADH dehydrogenase [ubiquinone] 1 alpha subcomplex assembly factor 7